MTVEQFTQFTREFGFPIVMTLILMYVLYTLIKWLILRQDETLRSLLIAINKQSETLNLHVEACEMCHKNDDESNEIKKKEKYIKMSC